jgi:hypothetical protein
MDIPPTNNPEHEPPGPCHHDPPCYDAQIDAMWNREQPCVCGERFVLDWSSLDAMAASFLLYERHLADHKAELEN